MGAVTKMEKQNPSTGNKNACAPEGNTYPENPEIVANTFNLVPNFPPALSSNRATPNTANVLLFLPQCQNAVPNHFIYSINDGRPSILKESHACKSVSANYSQVGMPGVAQCMPTVSDRVNIPNDGKPIVLKDQLASKSVSKNPSQVGMPGVPQHMHKVSGPSNIPPLNPPPGEISVTEAVFRPLPVTLNSKQIDLETSSNPVRPCAIFTSTGSQVAKIVTMAGLTSAPSCNPLTHASSISTGNMRQMNNSASVQPDQMQNPVVTIGGESHSVSQKENAVSKTCPLSTPSLMNHNGVNSVSGNVDSNLKMDQTGDGSPKTDARKYANTSERKPLTSCTQVEDLIPDTECNVMDKMSSERHANDAQETQNSKTSTVSSRDGSPTVSSTIVCSDSKDLKPPDKQEMVIDVDEEDIEDCMLVSIDLSKQKRPIGGRIHNLEVIIDSDEDEQYVTSTKKSCPDEHNESDPSLDTAQSESNRTMPMSVSPSKPISQSGNEAPSTITHPTHDLIADTAKEIDFSRVEEDIEVYIDKDIKEERPLIDPGVDLWHSSSLEHITKAMGSELLEATSDLNHESSVQIPSKLEALPRQRIDGIDSAHQNILSKARAKLTHILDKDNANVSPSSASKAKKRKSEKFGSEKKASNTWKIKKTSASAGAKKLTSHLSTMLNNAQRSEVVPDTTEISNPNTVMTGNTTQGTSAGKDNIKFAAIRNSPISTSSSNISCKEGDDKQMRLTDVKKEPFTTESKRDDSVEPPVPLVLDEAGSGMQDVSRSTQENHTNTQVLSSLPQRNESDTATSGHSNVSDAATLEQSNVFDAATLEQSNVFDAATLEQSNVFDAATLEQSNVFDAALGQSNVSDAATSGLSNVLHAATSGPGNVSDAVTSGPSNAATLGQNNSSDASISGQKYEPNVAISELSNMSDAATTVQTCLKCKRSFQTNVLMQEHLKCSPSCKAYQDSIGILSQHNPKDADSCVACKFKSHSVDEKFQHVARNPACLKTYASLCISCNANVTFTSDMDRLEQSKACRKKHLLSASTSYKMNPGVDQLKSKQNTGLLLMSAGLATLSSVNPSTSCTVRCEGCSSWFSSYARFKLHTHAHQSCKQFYDQRYSTKKGYETASERRDPVPSNKPKILCPVCSKKFATNAMLTIHLNENTSCRSKFLKCSAPKVAKRGQLLEKGQVEHSQPSSSLQQTEICKLPENGKKPNKEDAMVTNYDKGGEERNSMDLNLKEIVIRLSPKSVMCSSCYKPFFDEAALFKHLSSSPSCNKKSEDIHFQCSGCKKYFIGDEGLAKHIQKNSLCQARIDSISGTPVSSSSTKRSSSVSQPKRSLTKHSLKTQNAYVLNVDVGMQNKTLPEVIKPHQSLQKEDTPMPQTHACVIDTDEVDEIAHEFISDESGECSSSTSSSDEADVEFKCKICNRIFTEKQPFKQHMKQHRSAPNSVMGLVLQKIKCGACRKKLKTQRDFQAHLLKRSFCFLKVTKKHWYKIPGDVFSCKMCRKTFKSVHDLGKHCFKNMTCRLCYVDAVLQTIATPPSAVPVSSVNEDSQSALHEDSRGANEVSSSDQYFESPIDKDGQDFSKPLHAQEGDLSYMCEYCHLVFSSRFKFQLHFFNQKPDCLEHYGTLSPLLQAQVPYCYRCKNRFINIHKLRIHKCIGYRRYVRVCGHCNFKFPSLASLEAHAQNNEDCTKALETQNQEKAEEKSVAKASSSQNKLRDVAKKATFSFCGAQRTQQSQSHLGQNLKSQVHREAHLDKRIASGVWPPLTSSKNFSCRVCARSFPNHPLLLDHSYEHTEEKQYDCKRCGFMCYHYNRLVSHEAVHDRLDKECGHFNDRLDLHSTVVQDSDNSESESNASEKGSGTQERLRQGEKKLCSGCGQDFDSQRHLKKHLACSIRCRNKAQDDSLDKQKLAKVKQESKTVNVAQPGGEKKEMLMLKPVVKIVRVGSSGKRFLTASVVQQVRNEYHLYCFSCHRFLKSKEEVERHSINKRHTLISRRTLHKAVWLQGKYSCKICKTTMVLKSSLVKHMARKHDKGTSPLLDLALSCTERKPQAPGHKGKLEGTGKKFFCSLCKRFMFSSKRRHFVVHLKRLKAEIKASTTLPLRHPSKEFCEICQIPLTSKQGLLVHLDRHQVNDIYK